MGSQQRPSCGCPIGAAMLSSMRLPQYQVSLDLQVGAPELQVDLENSSIYIYTQFVPSTINIHSWS